MQGRAAGDDDGRQGHEGQHQGAHQGRRAGNAKEVDEDRQPQETEDDRGHRRQVVDVDLDEVGEPVAGRELLQVKGRPHAHGEGEQQGQHQGVEGTHESPGDARQFRLPGGALGEEEAVEAFFDVAGDIQVMEPGHHPILETPVVLRGGEAQDLPLTGRGVRVRGEGLDEGTDDGVGHRPLHLDQAPVNGHEVAGEVGGQLLPGTRGRGRDRGGGRSGNGSHGRGLILIPIIRHILEHEAKIVGRGQDLDLVLLPAHDRDQGCLSQAALDVDGGGAALHEHIGIVIGQHPDLPGSADDPRIGQHQLPQLLGRAGAQQAVEGLFVSAPGDLGEAGREGVAGQLEVVGVIEDDRVAGALRVDDLRREVHRQADVGLLEGAMALADDVGEEDGDEGQADDDGTHADEAEAALGAVTAPEAGVDNVDGRSPPCPMRLVGIGGAARASHGGAWAGGNAGGDLLIHIVPDTCARYAGR